MTSYAKELLGLGGAPHERQSASLSQHDDFVVFLDAFQSVRDGDDRATFVGQATKQRRDSTAQTGIKTRGRLIEKKQTWAGEQLHGYVCPLPLAAAQRSDPRGPSVKQVHLLQGGLDEFLYLPLPRVVRKSEVGCEPQRLVQTKLHVNDVGLRHVPDGRFHLVEPLVQVGTVDENATVAGRLIAGKRQQQRRLSRSAGS
jgi:hypothetical protein